MVLLGHLMQSHRDWQGRRLRLLRVVEKEEGTEDVQVHLDSLLREARIAGITKVVVSSHPQSAIQTTSRDAALVFLGLQTPAIGEEDEFFHRTEKLVGQLQRVALVLSAGGMRLES